MRIDAYAWAARQIIHASRFGVGVETSYVPPGPVRHAFKVELARLVAAGAFRVERPGRWLACWPWRGYAPAELALTRGPA